jgi:predicted RNA binding protein YcfA (HicA-like mRNA interferase family)
MLKLFHFVGRKLKRALVRLGWREDHIHGDHVGMYLGEDSVSVPLHDAIKKGTMRGIVERVASVHGETVPRLRLFIS